MVPRAIPIFHHVTARKGDQSWSMEIFYNFCLRQIRAYLLTPGALCHSPPLPSAAPLPRPSPPSAAPFTTPSAAPFGSPSAAPFTTPSGRALRHPLCHSRAYSACAWQKDGYAKLPVPVPPLARHRLCHRAHLRPNRSLCVLYKITVTLVKARLIALGLLARSWPHPSM